MRLQIEYEKHPGKPAYKCLADTLQSAIEAGRLIKGDTLPPSRELAQSLGLSRDTVVRAYDELTVRGLVKTTGTSGTYVTGKESGQRKSFISIPDRTAVPTPISQYSQRLLTEGLHPTTENLRKLNYGAPPAKLLPVSRWTKLLQNQCSQTIKYVYEPSVFGALALRQSIARYLYRSKEINCSAEQIVLFSETQSAINLLCRALLNENDIIAIEEPGYGGVKSVAVAQNLQMQALPVDHDGCRTDILLDFVSENENSIRLAYVTPAHHDPTGITLTGQRRQMLMDWASRETRWIVEDDYDGDLTYSKSNPRPLAASDSDRVIYISSFWKALYPLTSLGFVVLPAALIDLIHSAKSIAEPTAQSVEHLVLAEFIENGHLEKQWQKLNSVYRKQRSALLFHLKQAFRENIWISRESAGTHQLVRLEMSMPAERVCAAAAEAGLGVVGSAGYYLQEPNPKEFLVDFSNVSVEESEQKVSAFEQLLNEQS
jgi:GntR family transcriptional regulator/MocR family aminotransferase